MGQDEAPILDGEDATVAAHPSIGAANPQNGHGAEFHWGIGQVDNGESLRSIPASRQVGAPTGVLPESVVAGGLLSGTYPQQGTIGAIPRTPQGLPGNGLLSPPSARSGGQASFLGSARMPGSGLLSSRLQADEHAATDPVQIVALRPHQGPPMGQDEAPILDGEVTHADKAMSNKVLAVCVVAFFCLNVGFCHQQIRIHSLEIASSEVVAEVDEYQNPFVGFVIFYIMPVINVIVIITNSPDLKSHFHGLWSMPVVKVVKVSIVLVGTLLYFDRTLYFMLSVFVYTGFYFKDELLKDFFESMNHCNLY